jgi:hypothetical protein
MIDTPEQGTFREIEQLLKNEQYSSALRLLPRLGSIVPEGANRPSVLEIADARKFLNAALLLMRSRRAHYLAELAELEQQRAYLQADSADVTATLDVCG